MKRREFVKQSARVLIVGVTLRNSAWDLFAFQENVLSGTLPAPRSVDPEKLDAWLAVSADGKITAGDATQLYIADVSGDLGRPAKPLLDGPRLGSAAWSPAVLSAGCLLQRTVRQSRTIRH